MSEKLSSQELAALRHDLRTPINQIVGYAEMLLEDAADAGQAGRHAVLEQTIGVARHALELINGRLSSGQNSVTPQGLSALFDALREPQSQIVQAMTALLSEAGAPSDGAFADDLRKILSAAQRLVPAETPADAETSESGADGDDARGAEAEAGPARILVVDDVEPNRDVLSRRLQREGYRVECAENGEQALRMVAERPFDLVLLDVIMPQIDGYEVLKRLKDDAATRDIPVIMISALDEMPSIVRCIERGAEDYLPKPFDPVLLRARINASLEKKRLRDHEVEYLRQVDRVIEAATAVEAGTYSEGALADVASRADKLGHLARVFDGMAAQVRAREERLRDRVRDLRAEIEAARKTQTRPDEGPLDFASLPAGECFADRYEIVEMLGRGGMGMVYRARDLELDEEIAIKTLRPELLSDAALIERFKTEIRLARRISHRNVVRTHDFGEWSGVYYLTMEYVEGITVRELIDTRGQLGVSATLAIASQLAASLEVAHEQGVIHRDIKPQNLLLDREGALKVMDFGVARLAERTSTLTESGLIVGTPAYMSPEQLLAEKIDVRSDIYSVGVVMYECLTGALPFQAESTVSLIAKLLSEEPAAPVALNAEIPPALSQLIVQLLAKEADERVGSARELRERLSRIG